jgi:dTMP kinase
MKATPRSIKHHFGTLLPGCKLAELKGKLIVLEGADGSGRSTQIDMLKDWLENLGYGTVNVGLKRSTLVAEELEAAQQGNILSHTTRSLFYATDFADQLENTIIPALRAGFVVLADRYIYTLMARDTVRGANPAWVKSLYSIALVPDAVFYLRVSPQVLVERNFRKNATLSYWESGMDTGMSRDMFESFMKYQRHIQAEFRRMQAEYGFTIINGNRKPRAIHAELRAKVQEVLSQSS